MSKLLVKPKGRHGRVTKVTPKNAGWTYVGFELHRLAPGETVTGGKEKEKTAVARAAVPNVDIKILKRAMFRSAMAGALVGGALITALAVVLVVVLFII